MSLADLKTIVAEPWADWGLIDSGHGQKWERYGAVTVVRPEPQAMWAPALERLGARRDLRPRLGRGGRRPLGPAPRRPAKLAAGARRRPLPRQPDPVPPPRLLPRHGAAMGFDARAVDGRRGAQPVRLHRGRHPVAVRRRRADGPCRRVEEIGRGRPRQRRAVGDGRAADPLDRRRRRQVHRARSPPRAALRRHPARPAQVRPRPDRRSVAAGGASRAACSPIAASCSTPTAASSC